VSRIQDQGDLAVAQDGFHVRVTAVELRPGDRVHVEVAVLDLCCAPFRVEKTLQEARLVVGTCARNLDPCFLVPLDGLKRQFRDELRVVVGALRSARRNSLLACRAKHHSRYPSGRDRDNSTLFRHIADRCIEQAALLQTPLEIGSTIG